MKVKAANGVARILKQEGVKWISCYPTSHINNALGEEGVPIYMMGEERFGVAVADAFSRVTCGKRIGVCTAMAGLNAAGIQMAYGAIAQAWEDSSPLLVHGGRRGPGREPAHALRHRRGAAARHQVGRRDRSRRPGARLHAPRVHAPALGPARPGAAHRAADLGEYDEDAVSLHAGEGLAHRSRSGRRQGGGQGAARREGPAAPRRGRRLLRRRHRGAAAIRRARAGAGADDAESEGHVPREPSAVGRRARLACGALPQQVRPALLHRLEPLPQPVQPRRSRAARRRRSSSARWTRSTSTGATRRSTP